jgi:cytochrome oxidase assembly protein ShyY1
MWQLRRADEKRVVQRQFEALRAAAPIDAAQLAAATPPYTRVQISGTLDNAHSFLLDNRVSHGRVGYEVVTPLVLDAIPGDDAAPRDKPRLLLINRGWIIGDPTRRTRPTIPPATGTLALHGYIYRDSDNQLIGANTVDNSWPRVIEQIDVGAMQAALQQPAYPYVLRLDANSPAALVAEWPVVTSSPERHTAYAVQWFAMTAVLLLLWVWRSTNLQEWFGRGGNADDRAE